MEKPTVYRFPALRQLLAQARHSALPSFATPPQMAQELEVSSSELWAHADISSNQKWVLGVGVLLSSHKRSDLRIVGAVQRLIIPPWHPHDEAEAESFWTPLSAELFGLPTRCIFYDMNAIMSSSPSLPIFEPLECHIRSQRLVERPFTPSSHDLIIFSRDGKPLVAKNASPYQMVNTLERSNRSCAGGQLDADGDAYAPLTIM
jgi:hypothetical protein